MPSPDQIDASFSRQQGPIESDVAYAERIKRLDEYAARFGFLVTEPQDKPE